MLQMGERETELMVQIQWIFLKETLFIVTIISMAKPLCLIVPIKWIFLRETLFIVTIITMANLCLMVILIRQWQLTIWTKLLPALLFFLLHGLSHFSSFLFSVKNGSILILNIFYTINVVIIWKIDNSGASIEFQWWYMKLHVYPFQETYAREEDGIRRTMLHV